MRYPSILVLVVLASGCTSPEQPAMTARVDLLGRYMLNGTTASEGPVLQPSLKAAFPSGVTLFGLANYDLRDDDTNEVDLTADYTVTVNGTELTVGATYIDFTHLEHIGLATGRDVHATVAWPDLVGKPALTAVYDFGDGDGLYTKAAVSRTFEVAGRVIEGSLFLAHNDHYYTAHSGLSHWGASLAVPFTEGDWSIIPGLYFQDGLANPEISDEFFATLGVEYRF